MGEHKLNDQQRTTWTPPGPRPTCAECEFAGLVPSDLNVIECQGLPPQILLIPAQTPQGTVMSPQLTRPNLPRRCPSCALFKAKAPAPLQGLPGLMGDA